MEKQKRNKKIWVPVISVLTVLVIIANVVTAMFYNTITYYFKGANTTYDSADAKAAKLDAEGVVKEIVANGAVLLKNEDGTSGKKLLPLETDAEDKTKINVNIIIYITQSR